jgi:sugar lactone lactonase YvrE
MAFRKMTNGRPRIAEITPAAAIAGGELEIRGSGFGKEQRPRVMLGEVEAHVLVGSDSYVVARVPEAAAAGELVVTRGDQSSPAVNFQIGQSIATNVHPVTNPAVDAEGGIYTTLSGSRGQKTPVSVYHIDANYQLKPFLSDVMNATGLAFDREGLLYVSSRYDGVIYQVTPRGAMSVYAEGMGIATGLAFDREENLYVGDRSGTIFKISRGRQIYVFATLEPSISAYHLAFGPEDHLFVSGPTTSSFDSVYSISPAGEVGVFYRGLGRPQGLAFDAEGRLYVAASLGGRKGVVRLPSGGPPELFLSGPQIVGLAFAPARALAVATSAGVYRVDVGIPGRPLV